MKAWIKKGIMALVHAQYRYIALPQAKLFFSVFFFHIIYKSYSCNLHFLVNSMHIVLPCVAKMIDWVLFMFIKNFKHWNVPRHYGMVYMLLSIGVLLLLEDNCSRYKRRCYEIMLDAMRLIISSPNVVKLKANSKKKKRFRNN